MIDRWIDRWMGYRNKSSMLEGLGCRALPATRDENKSTKTWSAWGGKVADLSKEKGQELFPQWAFIGFILHRNTGKAHQSLSGRNDQIIDNIQRTQGLFWVRVRYLKGHKTLGNKLIPCLDPYQKIEGISKVGFIGFYVVFLRSNCPREPTLFSTRPHLPPALFQV